MVRFVAFVVLTLASPAYAQSASAADELLCGEAISIYMPEPQGVPASNIKLENFQYMSPGDHCGRSVDHAELMRLHDAIKGIASETLRQSRSSLDLMVRYTLTPDQPAAFEMQVRDAPESERPRLTEFYNAASALRQFRSAHLVYVVFHYLVSPEQASKPATDS